MKIEVSDEKFLFYKNVLKERQKGDYKTVFLDLGIMCVRVLYYSQEFELLLKQQLTYSLRDKADKYDYTIVLWKDSYEEIYHNFFSEYNSKTNLLFRVESIVLHTSCPDIISESRDKKKRLEADYNGQSIRLFDYNEKTVYYSVEKTLPEDFLKSGHMFVRTFYFLLKTESSSLVHGACIGYNGNGILLCARGQKGKSTLTVLAMLLGFDYVSDDYLTLQLRKEELFAYPIYSIMTLSPLMYSQMYDLLDGSRFVSNNYSKEKYVVNIANRHNQFKSDYPVKVCMYPRIVSDETPSVVKCNVAEKEIAMNDMVESTLSQMHDLSDIGAAEKIKSMISRYDFYEIRLCKDIYKNVECLREFAKTL